MSETEGGPVEGYLVIGFQDVCGEAEDFYTKCKPDYFKNSTGVCDLMPLSLVLDLFIASLFYVFIVLFLLPLSQNIPH